MSPFIRRSARGASPFLVWKVRLFAAGATLALGGMYLNKRWLVGVAIAVLAAGMALRFLPGDGAPDGSSESDERAEEPDDGQEEESR